MLDSSDSEGEKEHGTESRIQKIFTPNFKCVILAFSVLCVTVNIVQMQYLDGDKRIKQVGQFVANAEPTIQNTISEEEIKDNSVQHNKQSNSIDPIEQELVVTPALNDENLSEHEGELFEIGIIADE